MNTQVFVVVAVVVVLLLFIVCVWGGGGSELDNFSFVRANVYTLAVCIWRCEHAVFCADGFMRNTCIHFQNQNIYCPSTGLQGNLSYGAQ